MTEASKRSDHQHSATHSSTQSTKHRSNRPTAKHFQTTPQIQRMLKSHQTFGSSSGIDLMAQQQPSIPPAAGQSWKNVFYDDFTGEKYTLETNFRHPMGRAKWKWDAVSNKEIHWEPACSRIVPDATQCDKPILRVCVWSDWFHRIDRLATKQQFGYGYYECRLRFKGAEGMHSAFWLLPEAMVDDPVTPGEVVGGVEVDVVENRKVDGAGNDVSGEGNTAVHWGGYGANHRSRAFKLMALPVEPSAWATFGVLHLEGGMRWYWNGKEVNSVGVWTPMKNSIYFSTEVNESGGWAGNDLASYGPVDDPAGYIEVDHTGFWEQVSEPSQVSTEDEEADLYRGSGKEMNPLQERVEHLEGRLAMEVAELKELVQSLVSATQMLHERVSRTEGVLADDLGASTGAALD